MKSLAVKRSMNLRPTVVFVRDISTAHPASKLGVEARGGRLVIQGSTVSRAFQRPNRPDPVHFIRR